MKASEDKALLNTQGRSRRHNRKRDKHRGLCKARQKFEALDSRGLVCKERRDEYERFQRVTSEHEHNKYIVSVRKQICHMLIPYEKWLK